MVFNGAGKAVRFVQLITTLDFLTLRVTKSTDISKELSGQSEISAQRSVEGRQFAGIWLESDEMTE